MGGNVLPIDLEAPSLQADRPRMVSMRYIGLFICHRQWPHQKPYRQKGICKQPFGRHAPGAARVLRAPGRQVAREYVFPDSIHVQTSDASHILNRSSNFTGTSRSSFPSTSSNEDGSPFMSKR